MNFAYLQKKIETSLLLDFQGANTYLSYIFVWNSLHLVSPPHRLMTVISDKIKMDFRQLKY